MKLIKAFKNIKQHQYSSLLVTVCTQQLTKIKSENKSLFKNIVQIESVNL